MTEDQREPGDQAGDQAGAGTGIVPMPIFDPFREAEKWRCPPPRAGSIRLSS